jgi:hypothetical protein
LYIHGTPGDNYSSHYTVAPPDSILASHHHLSTSCLGLSSLWLSRHNTRKLSHYFQAHQIEVHTSSTLGEILNNMEATEKIAKWAIELSMSNIVYKPRTVIKAQALSDFMVEWTETQTPPKERELEYWTINFDGSLQLQGAGARILVTSPKEKSFKYVW